MHTIEKVRPEKLCIMSLPLTTSHMRTATVVVKHIARKNTREQLTVPFSNLLRMPKVDIFYFCFCMQIDLTQIITSQFEQKKLNLVSFLAIFHILEIEHYITHWLSTLNTDFMSFNYFVLFYV